MVTEGSVVVLVREIEVNGSAMPVGTVLVVHGVHLGDDDEFHVSTPAAPLDRFWVLADEVEEQHK